MVMIEFKIYKRIRNRSIPVEKLLFRPESKSYSKDSLTLDVSIVVIPPGLENRLPATRPIPHYTMESGLVITRFGRHIA